MAALLEVKGLRTEFRTSKGTVKSVDGVDFEIAQGEILGVVGESGSGKSVTSLSIMRLIPSPPGKIVGGEILFEGHDLREISSRRMRRVRGNDIAMIFQEPMTSLDPLFTIGDQIIEALRLHRKLSRRDARRRAVELLESVGLPRANELIDDFPHELSGGMRQRVMIAMAISCEPKLLIADEPTTALDVTIQAQILDLLKRVVAENRTAVLLITHDLGVVAETCDRVVVMYAGRVFEEAPVTSLFAHPSHPYTQGLLASMPALNGDRDRLNAIPGNVPAPAAMPKGCKFAPRCAFAFDRCNEEEPPIEPLASDPKHRVRCWLAGSAIPVRHADGDAPKGGDE